MRTSVTSRSVRRRRFSISARERSSLSLYSATSFASAVGSGGAAPLSVVTAACSPLGAAVVSVIKSFPGRLSDRVPRISMLYGQKSSAGQVGQLRGRQQLADDLGGVIDHRDDTRIIEPGRP